MKHLNDYGNFDGTKRVNETISLAEITKMLKDHKVVPTLMTKQEVQVLMKLIAVKLDSTAFLQFDFDKFKTFIVQAAMNIQARHPESYMRSKRPVEMIKELVSHF